MTVARGRVWLRVAAGLAACAACSPRAAELRLKASSQASPVPAGARVPELARLPGGGVLLSWLAPLDGGGYRFELAVGRGASWSAPRRVAEGQDLTMSAADLPGVAAFSAGALLAHWGVRDPASRDPYAQKVTLAVSADEGRTWSAPFIPHRDGVAGDHAFVSTFPVGPGLGLVWLDGRRQRYAPPEPARGEGQWLGSVGLYSTTVGSSGELGPETAVDPVTCECCPTAAAVGSRGPIVAYRNRSGPDEGEGLRYDQDAVRDIYVVRLDRGHWTAPQRVHADNWVFNGCPDNGPAVAADGERVAVAWWTAVDNQGAVKLAFSKDGGATFGPAIRVDEGLGLGQVTVAAVRAGAVVGWLEGGETRARLVGADGRKGPVLSLGRAAPHSRLPRWLPDGDEVIAAWSESPDSGNEASVRLARLQIE